MWPESSGPVLVLGVAAGVTGILLLVATVVGFLGSLWWVFELASNVRLQLALGLIVIMIALLAVRRWIPATVAAIGAAVNLVLVVPLLIVEGPAAPAPGADPVQITFFNTTFQADRGGVIAELRGREDDIVVLASADDLWARAFEGSDLEVVTGPHLDDRLQLLVLAREPGTIQVTVHRESDARQDHAVELTVALDGRWIHVLTIHAISPRTPQRARQRDRSLEWAAAWANSRESPVVVIGDLNVTPWSPLYRSLVDDTGLTDSQRHHGLAPSWPARLGRLGLPLDHVLHSPELMTVERELGPSFGSNHRMLHTTLAPREPRS